MPYEPNANWTAATAAGAKSPVYYLAIDGLTTKHFSTREVRSAAVTKKLILDRPRTVRQIVSQLQGRSTMTLTAVALIDRDGEVTDLVSTEKSSPTLATLINRKAILYAGYADLVEADYAPILAGQIVGWDFDPETNRYTLSLADLKRQTIEDVFANAEANSAAINTRLSAAASAGASSISLVSVENVEPEVKLFIGPNGSGAEEKATVLLVSGTTVTLRAPLVNSYAINDEVRWATSVLEGNWIDVVYAVWTGDFSSGTFPLTKKRGIPTGLNIPTADVDSAYLVRQRDRWLCSVAPVRFELRSPISGFRFLEQRIFRLIGYPFQTLAGKLAVRVFAPWEGEDAAAGLPQIVKADLLGWELERDFSLHVNRVNLGLDADPQSGEAAEMVLTEDTADQTATKTVAEVEEEDTGLRSAFSGTRIAQGRAAVFLRRFLKPPPRYRLFMPLSKRALEIGETVELTHDKMPDLKAGTVGLTKRRLEIVEREENIDQSRVQAIVQEAGFIRPAYVGPAGALPGYDSASAAQREDFAFVGPAGFPVGNFDDGTPPYEVV